jgi:hypothetical protein
MQAVDELIMRMTIVRQQARWPLGADRATISHFAWYKISVRPVAQTQTSNSEQGRCRGGIERAEEASNWPEIQNTTSCSSQSRSAQRPCETDSGSQLTAPAMGRSGREHRPISVA